MASYAVPFAAVATLGEAYAYAANSAKAAASSCPKAAYNYSKLAQEIASFVEEDVDGNWNEMVRVSEYKSKIQQINALCQQEKAGTVTAPTLDVSTPVKAGFPWWLLIGGGVLLYYLMRKK